MTVSMAPWWGDGDSGILHAAHTARAARVVLCLITWYRKHLIWIDHREMGEMTGLVEHGFELAGRKEGIGGIAIAATAHWLLSCQPANQKGVSLL